MKPILHGGRAALLGLSLVMMTAPGAPADTGDSSMGEQHVTAWITGYSYWDNSPPGSGAIARPVVHDEAGGIGTWDDPITIAVGRGGSGWHYAPGTRIYLADLHKYAVVEDLCGACGSGHNGQPHLDLYVGGENTTARVASACAMQITASQRIVLNPAPSHPVRPGEIAENC